MILMILMILTLHFESKLSILKANYPFTSLPTFPYIYMIQVESVNGKVETKIFKNSFSSIIFQSV